MQSEREVQMALEELEVMWEELAGQAQVLEREQARYAEFFEHAPDAYLVTEAGGSVREANRAAVELLAGDRRMLLGRALAEWIADEERVGFLSNFWSMQAVFPHMKRQGGGWIINIGSLAGKNPMPGGAAYNASKFGLLGFSEAMMLDVRHHGIKVSCVMPGSVSTHFNQHTPGAEADAWKIQPEDIGQIVMDLLAMPERTLPSRIEVRPTRPPKK